MKTSVAILALALVFAQVLATEPQAGLQQLDFMAGK